MRSLAGMGGATLMERSVTGSTLARTLARLRERAGLSRRQLEEVSDVSEETIKAVELGKNTRPSPETLRKIATGLATNRALERVDHDAADEIHTRLMEAARYVSPPAPPAAESDDALLRRLIERKIGSDNVALVEALLDQLRDRPAVDQQALLGVVAASLRLLPPHTGR